MARFTKQLGKYQISYGSDDITGNFVQVYDGTHDCTTNDENLVIDIDERFGININETTLTPKKGDIKAGMILWEKVFKLIDNRQNLPYPQTSI